MIEMIWIASSLRDITVIYWTGADFVSDNKSGEAKGA